MGSKRTLLLVDSDARSLRVLEVSLRKAGYEVVATETAAGALEAAAGDPPELVITESRLPDQDGYTLCEQLRAAPRTAHAAVLFLSEAASPADKMRAIGAGADDFLAKPALVKDILARIQTLLERRQTEALTRRDRPGNLSGSLANMGVVDLLQVMEAGQKSGIVHVSSDPVKSGGFVAEGQARGTIFFRDGQVIDARLGALAGADAVYRMLLWDDGVFEIEFKQVSRSDTVKASTQTLLLEGMRRVDEWSRFAKALPPLRTKLVVDYGALAVVAPVGALERSVLQLFDGRRSLLDVVNDASLEDTEALGVIAELHVRGVLVTPDRAASTVRPDARRAQAELELPSALGRAVIPSPYTPSQIMAAADPLAPDDDGLEPYPLTQVSPRTELPEPLPEPSMVLSRHTVPANRPVPLTQRPVEEEPIPLTQASQAPRLRISRVASTIGPLPTGPSAPADQGWQDVRAPEPLVQRSTRSPSAVALAARETSRAPLPRAPSTQRGFAQEPSRAPEPRSPLPRSPSGMAPPREAVAWPVARSAEPAAPVPAASTQPLAPAPWPRPGVEPVRAEPERAETAPTVPPRSVTEELAPASMPGREEDEVTDPHGVAALKNGAPSEEGARPKSSYVIAPAAPPVWDAPSAAEKVDAPAPSLAAQRAAIHAKSPVEAPAEVSKASDEFFNKSGDDDLQWEESGSWLKHRLPALVMTAAAIGVVVALAWGGKKEHGEVPAAPEAAAKRPEAMWPKTPEAAVVISGVESAPPEGVEAPGAPVPGAPVPGAPVPGAPAAATPPVPPEVAAAPAAPGSAIPAAAGAPAEAGPAPAPAPAAAPTPAAPAPKDDAKAIIDRGEAALNKERFQAARKEFTAAVAAAPENAEAHAGLAMALLELGNDRTAKSSAQAAIQLDEANARAHLVLAMVAGGDQATAKRHYQKYLEHAPTGKHAAEVKRILGSMR